MVDARLNHRIREPPETHQVPTDFAVRRAQDLAFRIHRHLLLPLHQRHDLGIGA